MAVVTATTAVPYLSYAASKGGPVWGRLCLNKCRAAAAAGAGGWACVFQPLSAVCSLCRFWCFSPLARPPAGMVVVVVVGGVFVVLVDVCSSGALAACVRVQHVHASSACRLRRGQRVAWRWPGPHAERRNSTTTASMSHLNEIPRSFITSHRRRKERAAFTIAKNCRSACIPNPIS